MTYLSRFPVNAARRGAHKLLGSPQAMHAAVLSSFPPDETAEARVLWRVDKSSHATSLYVLSPHRPDMTHLVEQAGWPTSDQEPWQTRSYDGLLAGLAVGQEWAFRLKANPVKAARNVGKIVGLVRESEQKEWLVSRAEALGFAVRSYEDGVPDLLVSRAGQEVFHRNGAPVTLSTVRFDGTLEIVDEEVFRRTLISGIGRAKGYGCGLMTIVRG